MWGVCLLQDKNVRAFVLSDHAERCQTAATGVRNPQLTFGFCRERAESSLKQVVCFNKKAGTLQDAGEHNAGGGVGGGRHTRVVGKLSADTAKTACAARKSQFQFSTKVSQKDDTHSAYSGLDSRQKL